MFLFGEQEGPVEKVKRFILLKVGKHEEEKANRGFCGNFWVYLAVEGCRI